VTSAHDFEHSLESKEMARIAIVALASAAVWFRVWEPFPSFSVIGILGAAIGMYPILREAFEAIAERRMTMELSMSIAIGAALALGEFFTALVIILFVLIAEVLENMTVSRGRRAIKDLLDFLPRNAWIRREGESREIHLSELHSGDVVVIKPGTRIPVDGVVIGGNSFVDQSTITGESPPVEKLPGTNVYAGTINQSGLLEVRTTGIGKDTAFGRIVNAVEAAEKSRAPIQKTADRLAGLSGLFRDRLRDSHVRHHAQYALHHFRGDCRWSVRYSRRNSVGYPRGDRQGGSSGSDYERWAVSGSSECRGYRCSRQNRDTNAWRSGDC
jgi:Cd2+/Zn2+-exporting ATPase/Cu+-exporting ATPase